MLRSHRHRPTVRPSARLTVEALEARCLLSTNVLQTNLVSDLPGVAAVQDPNLVNPWGISESSMSPIWIADNNAGVSSIYKVPGDNNAAVTINSLVVNIPSPDDLTGNSGTPTGTVFNIALGKGAFMITDGTHTAPAVFLFATEDGTIVGWNPGVDPTGKFDGPGGISTHAVIAVDNSGNNFTESDPAKQTGAVYKGLAIATDASGRTLLYATNFRSGNVDVFNSDFTPATMLAKNAFTDSHLPDGYAPFGIQIFGDKVYVTYALQNAEKHDDVAGQGHGFVDVYNLDGSPGLAGGKVRLVSRGDLNSPWGLAIAPASFGNLAGSLLVGNFKDGFIHAYNATTGAPLGTLKDPDGEPIHIDGLWALKVGNGGNGGDPNTVYFTAGLFDETHGLFGSLAPVAAGTPEGPAEAEMAIAALDVAKMDLNTVLQDITSGASLKQFRQDFQAFLGSLVTLARAEHDLDVDIRQDHSPAGSPEVMADQAIDTFFAELGSFFGRH